MQLSCARRDEHWPRTRVEARPRSNLILPDFVQRAHLKFGFVARPSSSTGAGCFGERPYDEARYLDNRDATHITVSHRNRHFSCRSRLLPRPSESGRYRRIAFESRTRRPPSLAPPVCWFVAQAAADAQCEISWQIGGMTPGSSHSSHIHEFADGSIGCPSRLDHRPPAGVHRSGGV